MEQAQLRVLHVVLNVMLKLERVKLQGHVVHLSGELRDDMSRTVTKVRLEIGRTRSENLLDVTGGNLNSSHFVQSCHVILPVLYIISVYIVRVIDSRTAAYHA